MNAAFDRSKTEPNATQIQICAKDGAHLAATLYGPTDGRGVSVLINSATGVPRGYYDAFAKYLAGSGLRVLTYDYRGVGGSRAVTGTMEDWGRYDQAAGIDYLAKGWPGDSVAIVGHSLGGQILGLANNIERVKAAFFVAAQSGYWRHWQWPRKARMWLLWWVLMPGLTACFGRFPGERIGTANLPARIARNWARWGRSPHYISDGQGNPLRPYNDRIRFPIRWLSLADDTTAPLAAVEALRSYYPNARQERIHMTPSAIGTQTIGHFGFFRRSMPRAQWEEAARWLTVHAR